MYNKESPAHLITRPRGAAHRQRARPPRHRTGESSRPSRRRSPPGPAVRSAPETPSVVVRWRAKSVSRPAVSRNCAPRVSGERHRARVRGDVARPHPAAPRTLMDVWNRQSVSVRHATTLTVTVTARTTAHASCSPAPARPRPLAASARERRCHRHRLATHRPASCRWVQGPFCCGNAGALDPLPALYTWPTSYLVRGRPSSSSPRPLLASGSLVVTAQRRALRR